MTNHSLKASAIILGLLLGAVVIAFQAANHFRAGNSEKQLLRGPELAAKYGVERPPAPTPAQQPTQTPGKSELIKFEADLKAIQDDKERARLIAELLNQWPEADWAAAAAWVQGITDEKIQAEAARHLLPYLAASNPSAAAQLVLSLSQEQARDLLGQALTTWADADWQAALDWSRELPADRMKEEALIHLGYRWMENDPGEALAFARDLPEHNTQLLTTLASHWAARDPANAATWASELPQAENRTKVLSSVVAIWAQTAPMEAAHFVASLPADEAQLQALISVVSNWSGKDPQTVASWVDQFPESPLREHAMEQLVTAWTTTNPKAAGNWLQDVPAAASRDAGVTPYAHLIAATQPETAFRWAETITSELARNRLLELTAANWLRENFTAAQDAISQSSLPDETKIALLGQTWSRP